MTSQSADENYNALNKYAVNLNTQARNGKLDPVIGRDEEIRRVLQILSRRTKNNPILVGEPGVGKTAIAEGLAHRIIAGDVPENLKSKQVYSLDMGALIAGAKYKGEFEDRLKSVVKEVIGSDGDVVLFIDEIHTLVGAGGGEGAMDAANILKPALARGELRAIGATTLNEFQKYSNGILSSEDYYKLLSDTLPKHSFFLKYVKAKNRVNIEPEMITLFCNHFQLGKSEVFEYIRFLKTTNPTELTAILKKYGTKEDAIKDFEKNLKDNLYKIWNRMSSGSYVPPPVRMVEIPKKDKGRVF